MRGSRQTKPPRKWRGETTKRLAQAGLWLGFAFAFALLASAAHGQVGQLFDPIAVRQEGPDWSHSWDRFVIGWSGFGSWTFLLAQTLELLLSAGLALVLAFHPRNYSRGFVANIDVVEQPKVLTIFSVVATIVTEVVQVAPAMAFVVFGIGGLMRFRTDMGMPKLTGRAILATVVGLAVGLELFPLAILGTAFGWILIYVLESRITIRLTVTKLPGDRIPEAAELYKEILERKGCRVLSEWVLQGKGEVRLFFLAPTSIDTQQVAADVREQVPPELIGKVAVKIA